VLLPAEALRRDVESVDPAPHFGGATEGGATAPADNTKLEDLIMQKTRFFTLMTVAALAGVGACRSDEPVQEVEVYPATETTTPAPVTTPTTDPMMTQPGDTMMMHDGTMHGDTAVGTTTPM
jgi:hypothetical protein